MICQRCRTSLLSRLQHHTAFSVSSCARQQPWQKSQLRNITNGKSSASATPPPPAPRQPIVGDISIPYAVSSATPGVSQPLSTPEAGPAEFERASQLPPAGRPLSSCVAGTKLAGLNYFKNKPDIFAKEDLEYPDWLWGLLEDPKKKSTSEMGGVDLSSMNKKQRKRHEKKMAARLATLPVQIPVHHQATDITPAPYNSSKQEASADETAVVAAGAQKRVEITKSARAARRKEIKESNFLHGL